MLRIYGVAFVDYKSGVPGVAVCVGYRNGAPNDQSEVIGARGAVRISGSGDQFVAVGQGGQWTRVPYEDPPATMTEKWRAFARLIREDLEPPTSGEWGRQIMEILFAAETLLDNRPAGYALKRNPKHRADHRPGHRPGARLGLTCAHSPPDA